VRVLILSDIHSNLAALEAVLRHAGDAGPIDAAWCLGDTVGYGPQPRECIARLRELGAVMVAGNHDRAATGAMGIEEFNQDAATAARWTMAQLSAEERSFLDGLPEVVVMAAAEPHSLPSEADQPAAEKAGVREDRVDPSLKAGASGAEFTLVHGTLRWPMWEYLYSHEAARAHLERQQTPFGLVGHTHVPMLVVEGPQFPQGCELYYLEDGYRLTLTREQKLVINPGGVGQPRDGDPRAAYALYDSADATLSLHRVEYDIGATQKLMEEARLPRWLIERLALGR